MDVTPGPAATGPRSAADETFVAHLVPHHRQVLELCRLALQHSNDPAVIALVRQVRDDQTRELAALIGWLNGWGKTVPEGIGGHMEGHNDIVDGGMSENDWKELHATPPQELQTAILRYLQLHNTGTHIFADAYLDNQLDKSLNRQVRKLAQNMRENRTQRTGQINALLKRLGPP